MILDLTRRPIMVFTELCPESIVVRTFQTKDVSGIISYKREQREGRVVKENTHFLDPGASLKRGDITCLETRLNLNAAKHAYEAMNATRTWVERSILPGSPPTEGKFPIPGMVVSKVCSEKPTLDLVPEPYEVATGAKDAITDQLFTWRAAISVQRLKELWLVSVRNISSGRGMGDLCTIAVRNLDPSPRLKEDYPLLQLTKKVAGIPRNAWEHLQEDEF